LRSEAAVDGALRKRADEGDWNLAPRDYISEIGLFNTKQAAINSLATQSPCSVKAGYGGCFVLEKL
jgi:hypothetical protein